MKTNYTDNNGNTFNADALSPCPFCGSQANILFTGNSASKNGRKARIKCSNVLCRCEIINATKYHNAEWVANASIDAWNKRAGAQAAVAADRQRIWEAVCANHDLDNKSEIYAAIFESEDENATENPPTGERRGDE